MCWEAAVSAFLRPIRAMIDSGKKLPQEPVHDLGYRGRKPASQTPASADPEPRGYGSTVSATVVSVVSRIFSVASMLAPAARENSG